MTKNNVLKLLLLYGLIKFSDQTNFESDLDSDKCIQCNIPKIRVKRAKYFQSPSIRYFKRPNFPPNYFSYTPPPNFLMNDEEQTRGPNKMYPNKKSNTQNLNDEDINNLVKNLSKGDLDRILEFAGDLKQKESYLHSNIRVNYEDQTQNNVNSISDDSTVYREQFNQQNYINAPYASNINDGFNKMMPDNTIAPPVLFTDNRNTMEEILPKPVNLREEPRFMNDYQILNSKKVPVAVAPTDSYKVENFGALPLSGHNSKLSSVSSYHVPHYTVRYKFVYLLFFLLCPPIST